MNLGDMPPKRDKVDSRSSYNKKHKGRLRPEDVEEDNPELAKFLRQRYKAEEKMKDKDEIAFYLVLVFQSEAQKDEFLDNIPGEVGVLYNMYVDGQSLAEAIEIPITPCSQGTIMSPLHKRLTGQTGIPRTGAEGSDYWNMSMG